MHELGGAVRVVGGSWPITNVGIQPGGNVFASDQHVTHTGSPALPILRHGNSTVSGAWRSRLRPNARRPVSALTSFARSFRFRSAMHDDDGASTERE